MRTGSGMSCGAVIATALMITSCLLVLFASKTASAKKSDPSDKPAWAKKDVRDYTDADLERLSEQWDEGEEPLPPDELPEHLRPSPPIDLNKIDMSNPENLLKATKKGKTLMAFVTLWGEPDRATTEELTATWQTGLQNAHIGAERYLIDDNRAIFMFKDGAQAWETIDFLTSQERCDSVTIENKPYWGKHSPNRPKDEL